MLLQLTAQEGYLTVALFITIKQSRKRCYHDNFQSQDGKVFCQCKPLKQEPRKREIKWWEEVKEMTPLQPLHCEDQQADSGENEGNPNA